MIDQVDLLEGLLGIYSPSYGESAAVDYLISHMAGMGMRAFRDGAGNAVGILDPLEVPGRLPLRKEGNPNSPPLSEGRKEVRDIVLLGHIDTAPGVVPVRRDIQASGAALLYGRGAVDAKGPLCAFACAAARVGAREGWRIVVIAAVEEECPTSKGAQFAKTEYQPEYAVIGEPSGWDRITLGYKGSLWVNSTHKRAMAHTAGRGKSAPEEAVEFWWSVKSLAEEFNRDKERVFDKLDPTLRGMASESDGIYETAKLTVGLRLPLSIGVSELEGRITELAGTAELQFSTEVPAFRAEKNNALVRAFLASIRASGGEPGFTLKTGTSDMNILGPHWSCPIVTFGPGDSNLDHTPDEHIVLGEYEKSIDVLAQVLESLTTQA